MSERRGITADDLERLRVAVQGRVNRSTLRAVAREIRMSPTGLGNFIDARTTPYGPTIDRLCIWYHRRHSVHQRAPAVVAAELRDLVVTLPEPDAGVANLLAAVDVSYLEAGMFSPEWVNAVRAVVGR